MTEQDILNLIKEDEWMMNVLEVAEKHNLKDWAIGAGFVRNKIWDSLEGNNKSKVDTSDIDLVYFDPLGNTETEDEELSKKLESETGLKWEVVNEFYAHKWNNLDPYISTEDAISKWPETVTAVGVTLENQELKLIAPYGIDDLVNFRIKPTPAFMDKTDLIRERVNKKQWKEKWPKISLMLD